MGVGNPVSKEVAALAIGHRRFDLDWLRVIAFGLLIYYHSAIAFIPGGVPMIQNEETSLALQVAAAFLHQFRLALLFLVSGVGVFFALRRRNRAQFMRERSLRLLVPLIFGILVIVPPMVFLEKRFVGEIAGRFTDSFVEFYMALFADGVYPSGSLSWHHYWFIAYLFLYCVIAWPVFAYFKSAAGLARLDVWSRSLSRGTYLYVAIIPLALVEIALRAKFPGFPDLIHDWANFSHFFMIFIAGFLLASSTRLLDQTQALRRMSLFLGIMASAALFAFFWSYDTTSFSPPSGESSSTSMYVVFCVLSVANVWFWLIACLGYAGTYLQRPSSMLSYLNNAVYPLFCLHLTIVVVIEYLVVPLSWSIPMKYLVITTGAVAISLGGYELIRQKITWLQPFIGLKTSEKAG
jgi:glucan biosynthesis protein C